MHSLWKENYNMNCSWQHPSLLPVQTPYTHTYTGTAFSSYHVRSILTSNNNPEFTLQLIPTKHLIFKIHLIKLHEFEINLSKRKKILFCFIGCSFGLPLPGLALLAMFFALLTYIYVSFRYVSRWFLSGGAFCFFVALGSDVVLVQIYFRWTVNHVSDGKMTICLMKMILHSTEYKYTTQYVVNVRIQGYLPMFPLQVSIKACTLTSPHSFF